MSEIHEAIEKAQEGEHGEGFNRRIALVIAILALFLSFSETLGKSAQTAALNHQIEASNLWNFFQAKSIRRTTTLVAAEQSKLDLITSANDEQKAAISKQVDEWNKTAARYRSASGSNQTSGVVSFDPPGLDFVGRFTRPHGMLTSGSDH